MYVCCRSPTHLSALPAQLLSQGDEHEQLEQLEAQVGLSGSQFSSKFFAAFVLSLAQTLLLLDLLKVILLTLTSGPSLNALLPRIDVLVGRPKWACWGGFSARAAILCVRDDVWRGAR